MSGLYRAEEDEPAFVATENLTSSLFEEDPAREAAPPYRGVIVIEWPPPAGTSPYACLNGSGVAIADAVSGKPITTCSDLVIHAEIQALVTADLTMFADKDGEPILDGEPVLDGDEIQTGVFPFVVSEMRVRPRASVTPKGGSRF